MHAESEYVKESHCKDVSRVQISYVLRRLFYHECLRVFHDRLINLEDKSYFYRLLNTICASTFGTEVVRLPEQKIIKKPPLLLFGDFMAFGAAREQRIYEELTEIPHVKRTLEVCQTSTYIDSLNRRVESNWLSFKSTLQDYLEDYKFSVGKDLGIIFFMDAIEHVCRLARILRSERGNGLLIGVGGTGKQSLTRLASHLNGYKFVITVQLIYLIVNGISNILRCYQIAVTRTYDQNSWHEDLRRFYFEPGTQAKHTTFLFTDTQIVLEEFLEDINNTLNTGKFVNTSRYRSVRKSWRFQVFSGEVPNLYEADELEKVIIATRPAAKTVGITEENRDAIYQFFIGRVRNQLHLMICMSPIGDAFRSVFSHLNYSIHARLFSRVVISHCLCRRRCRMFPSLVNCCTIDWFTLWPDDALLSVAENSLMAIVPKDPEKLAALSSICVLIHGVYIPYIT